MEVKEAEMGVVQQQAKEGQGLMRRGREEAWERQGRILPSRSWRENGPANLFFRLAVFITGREYISVDLSQPLCATLLRQLRETSTDLLYRLTEGSMGGRDGIIR